jgi:cyclophilin family peptidyl-prolyl cis-trans isomerase
LNEVLALSDIISAYEKVKFESVKILLVRLIARLPVSEGQVAFLIARADDENAKFRYEAINGLVQTGTDSTKVKLLDILGSADRSIADKQAVLSALGTKHTGNKDVAQVVKNYSQDENRWLAVRALQAGIMADAEFYEGLADEWLKSDDYYKAFQAMVALSRSDDGKAKLLDFAASSNNFVRAREARIAVDPSIEARSTPRVSPTYAEVSKSRSRITLKTTRGDIIMETHLSAPFTAYNFTALAKEGKMDGMLWHRVIPNFVAQAGQKEDKSLYEWGSVREEWAGGTHTVGSVGVATAGKDTGGTQFFINTQRNLHLDGRYTVFAHIVEGMDVVYSLEEGDLINKAIVEETPIDETE